MAGKGSKSAMKKIIYGGLVFWLALASPPNALFPQGGRGALNEQQILKDALGAFADRNIQLARQKAEQIRDVPGSIGEQARTLLKLIDDIMEVNRKRQSAIIAIQRRDFAAACNLLNEIQTAVDANNVLKARYPDLGNLKAKAGGCPSQPPQPPPSPEKQPESEPVDTVKPLYDRAVNLMEEGKLMQALRIFRRIQAERPGYKDVEALISEITHELAGTRPKPKPEDEKESEITKKPPEPVQTDSAKLSPRPGGNEARKREEKDLVDALTAFYAGKYDQSYQALEDFLRRPHSASMLAFARFYAGAALGSKYFLSGGKDESARNAAVQFFRQAVKQDPFFSPRWDSVSPKIRDLFAEATKK